jgi:hypoxanthine phosphoribosyltransferase
LNVLPDVDEFNRAMADARVIASADAVDRRIGELAARIERDLRDRLPIVLSVLMGGAYLATGLCRHFGFPYESDALRARRYGHSTEGSELEWLMYPALPVERRDVLVVDDVLDRGETLNAVQVWLRTRGAQAIHTAVLVRKQVEQSQTPQVDYVGFECGGDFLVGCGMDFKGLGRGLPALYALVAAS